MTTIRDNYKLKTDKKWNIQGYMSYKFAKHFTSRVDLGYESRKVLTDRAGLYNIMAREYTYESNDKSNARIIHNSSSAVIHLIDGPLLIEN